MTTNLQAVNRRKWVGPVLGALIVFLPLCFAPSTKAQGAPATSASASRAAASVDLESIQAEGQLVSMRLLTGVSQAWGKWAAPNQAGNTTGKNTGLALRLALGPTITPDFAMYFEVGGQFYEKETHLTLAAAPTWVLWRPRNSSLTVTGLLGTAHNDYDSASCGSPQCPSKFQPHVGVEFGWWSPLGKAATDDPVSQKLNRLAELANEYRLECRSTDDKANADSATCIARAELMESTRGLLDPHANEKCLLDNPLLDSASKKISGEVLRQIEQCQSKAWERRHRFIIQPKWGIAPRLTYTFARDLPRVTTLELALGFAL